MIRKIIIIISAVAVAIALAAGIVIRGTYMDIEKKPELTDEIYVAGVSSKTAEILIEQAEDMIYFAPIVLKVKAYGETDYLFGGRRQLVSVEKVFSGDNIKEGEDIYITSENWVVFRTEPDLVSMNTGFVNFMKKDNEYLVFLSKKINVMWDDNLSTYMTAYTTLTPIFNYESSENIILEPDESLMSSVGKSVQYKTVKDNEFFALDEEALRKLNNFKERAMEKYKD